MNTVIKISIAMVRKVRRLTDGIHVYWRDGLRVRWAIIDWTDNGLGGRTHGAAVDLLRAIEDAEQARRDREDPHDK